MFGENNCVEFTKPNDALKVQLHDYLGSVLETRWNISKRYQAWFGLDKSTFQCASAVKSHNISWFLTSTLLIRVTSVSERSQSFKCGLIVRQAFSYLRQ